jgi:Cu-processing system permease protein
MLVVMSSGQTMLGCSSGSELMCYTGAVFERFFGTLLGSSLSLSILVLWSILPFGLSLIQFKRKDL